MDTQSKDTKQTDFLPLEETLLHLITHHHRLSPLSRLPPMKPFQKFLEVSLFEN
jgi:hypothetical protein